MKKNTIQFYIEQLKAEDLLISASGDTDAVVEYLTFDSRKVAAGTLFICKGAHFKAEYLEDSVKKGAVCYVSENEYDVKGCAALIVKDIRKAMSVLALGYYGKLSDRLNMIGVTGTKGKSTITYFTKYIFDEWLENTGKKRIAVCSGITNYDGVTEAESQLTTPENLPLFEHMNNALESGIEYMVMEVSSQGLKYGRVDGVEYEVACFNNIGEDHISPVEHPDFEDYFASKLKIFKQSRHACINMDSDHFDRIAEAASIIPTMTYSIDNEKADVYGYNITSQNGQVEFDVRCQGKTDHIALAAFGTINVINALAAISIATIIGVPMEYIKAGLAKAVTPGRMQVFSSKDGKHIGLVDYAHNKLSYVSLLTSIKKEFPNKDIVMVFGSSGGKAFNRREELGTEAGKYCKHVYLTEDDGAEENVTSICEEIAQYLGPNCTYEIIEDRPAAVRKAVRDADENTIVIAAGKAMETFQKRGDHSIKIESDIEVMTKEYANK